MVHLRGVQRTLSRNQSLSCLEDRPRLKASRDSPIRDDANEEPGASYPPGKKLGRFELPVSGPKRMSLTVD